MILIVVFMPDGIWGFVGTAVPTRARAAVRRRRPSRSRCGPPIPARRWRWRCSGLAKYFGGLKAVDGVDFTVRRGGVHALIGPNGSGKTTTLNVVSGPLSRRPPGAIFVDGVDVTALPAHQRTIAGLARTFQNIRLFRSMTALENVVIGAERDGNALVAGGRGALVERARAALDFVGLGARARRD